MQEITQTITSHGRIVKLYILSKKKKELQQRQTKQKIKTKTRL